MLSTTRILTMLLSLLCLAAPAAAQSGVVLDDKASAAFRETVDLSPFATLAVFRDGRLKSFDSHASELMQFVTGPHRIDDQSKGFTYLDFMFRPSAYENRPLIFVKKKLVRAEIRQAIELSADAGTLRSAMPPAQMTDAMDTFMETGLLRRAWFDEPAVIALLTRLGDDLIRTAKPVQQIENALTVADPEVLRTQLRVVPPADGDRESPWVTILDAARNQATYGERGSAVDEIAKTWLSLGLAWSAQDAARVNELAPSLIAQIKQLDAELYPEESRLAWESWYFKSYNMTWVWLIYMFSIVFLVMSVIYRWNTARFIGLGIFLIAFGFHTFSIGLRWYVAERWPNSNMFEAVTTAAWFGGAFAVALELFLRKTAMRNLFALGSAAASMTALMAAYYLPLQLDANIRNMMPVLHDVWLYIHTNVIIFSYCLIFMAAVTGIGYVIYRLFAGGKDDYARVGGAGSFIAKRPDGSAYLASEKTSIGMVLDGATMVLMELSFVLLWAGIVMGAIWADHSWGRPWGWDPKEVFALNTFIVFAILVHVRLKVKDKGLWTALLAVFGAITMLFNWIFINFYISGLHSYA